MLRIERSVEKGPADAAAGGGGRGSGLEADAFLGRMDTVADPVEWAIRRCGFVPDAKQRELLQGDWQRVILNCCRQWGKSTMAGLVAAFRAVHVPGSLVLVASPSERQSRELVRKTREFLERAGVKLCGGGQELSVGVAGNGSRIVGLSKMEETARGFSGVSMLIVDEAARVKESFYRALRPMLAVSGGSLWLLSTPWYEQGFFWKTWRDAGYATGPGGNGSNGTAAGWRRVMVTALDNPRITRKFLEEEYRTQPEDWFRQEYFCEFATNPDRVFTEDMIDACFSDEIEPILFPGQEKCKNPPVSKERIAQARANLKAKQDAFEGLLDRSKGLAEWERVLRGEERDADGAKEPPANGPDDGGGVASAGSEGMEEAQEIADDRAGEGGDGDVAGSADDGGERVSRGTGMRMPDVRRDPGRAGGPIQWSGPVLEGVTPVETALERERLERILRGDPEPGQRRRRRQGPLW